LRPLEVEPVQWADLVAVLEPLLQTGRVEPMVAASDRYAHSLEYLAPSLVEHLQSARRGEALQADGALIDLSPLALHPHEQRGYSGVQGEGSCPQFLELAVAEELHEEDHEFDDEDGEDEGGGGVVGLHLCEVVAVEGEVHALDPVEDHLPEVLVVGDVVALLQRQQVPHLQELRHRHQHQQVLEGNHQEAEDQNVVHHLPDVQRLLRPRGHLLHQPPHFEPDEHQDARHQHQHHSDLHQFPLVVAHVLSEPLELVVEAEREGGVVDPEEGDGLEAPALLDGLELAQDDSVVLVEVEPLVVEEDEHQPDGDELVVVVVGQRGGRGQPELEGQQLGQRKAEPAASLWKSDRRPFIAHFLLEALSHGMQMEAAWVLKRDEELPTVADSKPGLIGERQSGIEDEFPHFALLRVLHLDDEVQLGLSLPQRVQALPLPLREKVGEQVGVALRLAG
jgi:hypothetical protein